MPSHAQLQQIYQFWIHEGVIVWNIQTYDPLPAQGGAKTLLQLGTMLPLHHHDHIGPSNQFCGQRIFGIMIGTRRRNLKTWIAGKHLLGGWAAQAILTAK